MNNQFICLRYFFVPLENDLFLNPLTDQVKEMMFTDRFLVNNDYMTHKGKRYAIRISSRVDGLTYGKLSIYKVEERHILRPDDIDNVLEDDWPYVLFCLNPNTRFQTMVITINSDITTNIDRLCSDLSEIATSVFIQDGYKVAFNPINEKRAFWEIINHSDYIYSLTFRLNSPNIFGSSSNANESLKSLRQLFNNDTTTLTIRNEKGRLQVKPEDIDTYRDYADRGGGSWKLSFRKKKKKRHSYDTAKRALKITLLAEAPDTNPEKTLKDANTEFEGKL